MANLETTLSAIQTTDWYDNPITIKQVTSAIDGKDTTIITTNENSETDAACVLGHKAILTSQGFTWDN